MAILEARLQITGDDKTGPAFKAVEAKMAAIGKSFGGAARVSQAFSGLGASASEAANAVEKIGRGFGMVSMEVSRAEQKVGSLGRSMKALGGMAKIAGGFIAGALVFDAANELVSAPSRRAHEQARGRAAGMTPLEIGDEEKLAAQLEKKYPSIGETELMHMIRNARSIVGTYEEAAAIMDPIAKLRVTSQAINPGADMTEDFDKLLKGIEIKGATQNPEEFKLYMTGITKALGVFGDTLKPEDYYEAFKYSRQAIGGLSRDFLLNYMPTMAQEFGGASTGTAISAVNRAVVGGVMKKGAAENFVKFGLVDPKDVIYTSTGDVKGIKPMGVHGWREAQANPYNWVQDFYLPALKAHGITGKDEILAQMGSDFQNKLAGQAVGNWATQQSRYGKDLALINKAPDETAEMYQRTDPMTAWEGVKKSLISAAGTMGEGFAQSLAAPMNDLSKAISGYTDRLTGFMGKHPGIGSFIEEHPVGALTGLGAAGMTGVLGALWAGSRMYRTGAAVGDAAVTALGGASRTGLAFAAPALGPLATVAALTYPSALGPEDEAARQRRYSTIPGAITPLPSGTFAPGPVTAKLDGQASINVAVSIDAPPELLALMRSNVTATAFGDVRPDTGVSMPESSPSQGGRNGVWR